MTKARKSLRVNTAHEGRRTFVDLCIAVGIAFALLLLNVFINLSSDLRVFFADRAHVQVATVLVNGLFFWLVVLLWLAFARWRSAVRVRGELEDVLSSISPDALVVVSPDRTILMCNSSVPRIFGFAEDEVLGKKTDLLYFDRRVSKEYPREVYDALTKEGFHVGIATGRKKDGGTVPLEIISGELRNAGGAVLLLRDISERIRMEEEHRRLELRARQAQKLESLGVLAGGIAHDFNNLLMIIQGHTDLTLMNLPETAPAHANIVEIEKATNRAADLCGHLLSYSGKSMCEQQPVDLSRVVQETAQLLSVSIGKNATLKYELASALPAVNGDPTQLQQVAMNLINNAVEALDGKEGAVTVSTGVRDCDAAYLSDALIGEILPAGRYAYLEVTDTGCGMTEETRLRICDPFFTTKPTGHGMGLAAVVGVVRGHMGAMRIVSKVGEGSTFTVLFPIGHADGQPV